MKFYDRFEQTIAITLTGIISVIILVSVVQLIRNVFFSLILGALDPLEHNSFQAIFGMIMTVLIAMDSASGSSSFKKLRLHWTT